MQEPDEPLFTSSSEALYLVPPNIRLAIFMQSSIHCTLTLCVFTRRLLIILFAAREQDGIIGQRAASGIRPVAHTERLVFALVVQFLPEQFFKAAQIPQVPEDIKNRLLSFNLGHSSLARRASTPAFSFFRSRTSLDKPPQKTLFSLPNRNLPFDSASIGEWYLCIKETGRFNWSAIRIVLIYLTLTARFCDTTRPPKGELMTIAVFKEGKLYGSIGKAALDGCRRSEGIDAGGAGK